MDFEYPTRQASQQPGTSQQGPSRVKVPKKEYAVLSYLMIKPRPWLHHRRPPQLRPVGSQLARIVRRLKCLHASEVFVLRNILPVSAADSHEEQKPGSSSWLGGSKAKSTLEPVFPFLQRALEAGVDRWPVYEKMMRRWTDTMEVKNEEAGMDAKYGLSNQSDKENRPPSAAAGISNNKHFNTAMDNEDLPMFGEESQVIEDGLFHQHHDSRDEEASGVVKMEIANDIEEVAEPLPHSTAPAETGELMNDTRITTSRPDLLRSFYTVVHIGKMMNRDGTANKNYPTLDALSNSALVTKSMLQPGAGYPTSDTKLLDPGMLCPDALLALRRWSQAQRQPLLTETREENYEQMETAPAGNNVLSAVELWNSMVEESIICGGGGSSANQQTMGGEKPLQAAIDSEEWERRVKQESLEWLQFDTSPSTAADVSSTHFTALTTTRGDMPPPSSSSTPNLSGKTPRRVSEAKNTPMSDGVRVKKEPVSPPESQPITLRRSPRLGGLPPIVWLY